MAKKPIPVALVSMGILTIALTSYGRVADTHINAERLAVTGRPPFTEWSVLLGRGVRCSWGATALLPAYGQCNTSWVWQR